MLNTPKTLLAVLIIVGGTLFILVMNPPHTVCDSQMSIFKESQEGNIFKTGSGKKARKPRIEKLIEFCKKTNTPGGCYELFLSYQSILEDLKNIPSECREEISSVSQVKKNLWGGIEIMATLAWGETPPEVLLEKFGWLSPNDLTLFCSLKDTVALYYGKPTWNRFREKMLKKLPGAKKLSRAKAWEKTLLSTRCDQYR